MNLNKTISANSKGILISFRDVNKHKFVYYSNNEDVRKIQQNGASKYQTVEHSEFNKVQQLLYNQAVYGLKSIPNEVLMQMQTTDIRAIETTHSKAKTVINEYKQEVSNSIVDSFFLKLFPKSNVTKAIVNTKGTDSSIGVNLSLRDLKITPHMLAERLMRFNVLPENFFNLA